MSSLIARKIYLKNNVKILKKVIQNVYYIDEFEKYLSQIFVIGSKGFLKSHLQKSPYIRY